MPILSIQPGQVGVSNNTPSWVYIETNDTIAAVTTAGYLSGAAREYVNTFKPNMMALVSTKTSQSIGVAPVLYLLQLQNVAGVWSLVAPAVDVPVPFIVLGDIQAGQSGTAGKFISFPSAASKGSFLFKAVANTGDTLVTVSNALHGQASVYSIPDSGAATANFILSKLTGTQHITVGALQVDAGVISSGISTGGTAGGFIAYPSTTTNGSLRLTPVGNVGNFAASISNIVGLGQASVYTLPDPGAATANFIIDHGTQAMAAGSQLNLAKVSASEAANAVTASGNAGFITTSALTTAGGGTYAITWTNTHITATSVISLCIQGGSNNATNNITFTCVPGSGTATLTIYNNTAATALNGTLIIGYVVS